MFPNEVDESTTDIKVETPVTMIKEERFLVQCSECQNIFTRNDFRSHVCLIEVESPPDPAENTPPCLALMEANSIRMLKFMKEELKMNLSTTETNNGEAGAVDCHICNQHFSTPKALQQHLQKQHEEPKETVRREPLLDYEVCFVCLICGRAFANVWQCEQHLWHSDSHRQIEGIEGGDGEKNAMETTSSNENRKSEPDGKGNEGEESHGLKMDAVVLKFVFQCEFCDFVFARKEDLLKHEATHDPKLGYLCTACEINTNSTKDIQQHWQIFCPFASAGQLGTGTEGNGKGNAESLRTKEFAEIRLPSGFVCNVCFETYSTMDILYEHRHKESHYFPRYSYLEDQLLLGCEVCGDVFDACSKYCEHFEEQHTRKAKTTATGQPRSRQYLCDVCGKMYTQSSHLWQHLRFHQGVKPFKCSVEGCDRRFTIRPDLNDHVRKFHTHERPYQCLVCGKRFLTGSVFYQHRLIHRGERRYECETCNKKFFRGDALKNHSRIHSGEKPFQCVVCLKNFRQRSDCQKHMEARHMKQQKMSKQP